MDLIAGKNKNHHRVLLFFLYKQPISRSPFRTGNLEPISPSAMDYLHQGRRQAEIILILKCHKEEAQIQGIDVRDLGPVIDLIKSRSARRPGAFTPTPGCWQADALDVGVAGGRARVMGARVH